MVFLSALWTAAAAAASPFAAVIKTVPLYVYGFALCLLFGFNEGCRCERQHVKKHESKCVIPATVGETPEEQLPGIGYKEACDQASKDAKPVIVFLGVRQRPIAGAVTCVVRRLGGLWNSRPGIIVGFPGTPRRVDLEITASDDEIAAAVTKLSTTTVTTTFIETRSCPGGVCPSGR